jgi:hypothetical protein
MGKRFAVGGLRSGDRQRCASDRVPRGTLGTVVKVFARLLEICDVQFDDYADRCALLTNALEPMLEATPPAHA